MPLLTLSSGMARGLRSSRRRIGGNDAFTKILLHFDGADASTTFTDSNVGGSAKTWTANGNAQIDTAQSKFGGASGLFDGTGDYITTPDHGDFTLGSGDFTIDYWAKRNANGDMRIFGQCDSTPTDASISVLGGFNSSNQPIFMVLTGGTPYAVTSSTAVTDTNWHHYAGVRNGNTLTYYVDGTSVGTADVTGVTVNNSTAAMSVGRLGEFNSLYFNGWIDEFRYSVGIARWTSNFTPPAAAYS